MWYVWAMTTTKTKTWATPRRLAAGAGLLLAVAGCGLPPGGEPPDDELQIQVTNATSFCEDDACTGEIIFRVTNPTDAATTETPVPTVDPDDGSAIRDVSQSTCDDGPLAAESSCSETYDLQSDSGSLTGTISVDAGNLEGGTTYSA